MNPASHDSAVTLHPSSQTDLAAFARLIRRDSLEMIYRARSSHIGSCFSIAELLAVLYSRVLSIDPELPDWPARDRFILSKGHASAALYSALATKGFFPRSRLNQFYADGSSLPGHATHTIPGVEVSTGSLGHGLSIACGMSLAAKMNAQPFRVFVLLSDGECDEGSVWEAMLFAAHHRLDNLIAIVDYNKIQSLGEVSEVLDLAPFTDKWRAFRWSVREIDGHNLAQVEEALTSLPFESGAPSCLIAHTVKGQGVSFMENRLLWHYRSPDDEEFARALAELSIE